MNINNTNNNRMASDEKFRRKTRGATVQGRFVLAASLLATLMSAGSTSAFVPINARLPTKSAKKSSLQYRSPSKYILSATLTDEDKTSEKKQFRPNPVVVSAEAEALSHSATTMKLTPSYELFQMLDEAEGGTAPQTTEGNAQRDDNKLKVGQPDTLDDFQLSDYKGLGGTKKIEILPDPFKMVEKELQPFSDSISELVSSDQPILSMAAKHFFEKRHGKRFRPTIVQLMAKTVAAVAPETNYGELSNTSTESHNGEHAGDIDNNGLPGGVAGWEWSGASKIEVGDGVVTPDNHKGSEVWRRQAQLGQIVEMIHVASLIHDDVLDEADTRRGGESVHKLYSNKVAVLAGDYLLARASVLLARLENTAVVQIMATALESLVAGEIMQLKSSPEALLEMESYLRKSYYKTASLICYACRSTALLGGHAYGSTVATACEEFGFHMGLAFQIQDDILDFTAAANVLGKPALADMDLGLSTAPILYAAQEYPHLRPLVMRRFKKKGDKQAALEALFKSETAMDKARDLARFHAQRAIDALLRLPQSESRDALVRLTHVVITRKK
uniref:Polyprenyl synthetase n=2 Tax=Ditylum brightwellii TaxID=49249 RepID=A0A6U3UKH7_9STRA|mmetsp:Transcript_39857/g.59865  ORF Transcript_39857/g.59865 Transcript_39857/m.59865 type:complete len:559 (+) Transcript_39857:179-1855(+)